MKDASHENMDVQGREGIIITDRENNGQQWFPWAQKLLRLFLWYSSGLFFYTWVVPVPYMRKAYTHFYLLGLFTYRVGLDRLGYCKLLCFGQHVDA